jgi:hypothetical protein
MSGNNAGRAIRCNWRDGGDGGAIRVVSLIDALLLLVDWLGNSTDCAQAFAIILMYFLISLPFLIANAAHAVRRIFRRQSAREQLIGCTLPPLSLVIPDSLQGFSAGFYRDRGASASRDEEVRFNYPACSPSAAGHVLLELG